MFGLCDTTLQMKKWLILWKGLSQLEESGLLIKGVSKTIKNQSKERRGGFLGKEYIEESINRYTNN